MPFDIWKGASIIYISSTDDRLICRKTPCSVHMSICQYIAACAMGKLKVRCVVFHQGWTRREIFQGASFNPSAHGHRVEFIFNEFLNVPCSSTTASAILKAHLSKHLFFNDMNKKLYWLSWWCGDIWLFGQTLAISVSANCSSKMCFQNREIILILLLNMKHQMFLLPFCTFSGWPKRPTHGFLHTSQNETLIKFKNWGNKWTKITVAFLFNNIVSKFY